MNDTPINYEIVKRNIEESNLANLSKATIREIKKLIDEIEKASGEKIYQDGNGYPWLASCKDWCRC